MAAEAGPETLWHLSLFNYSTNAGFFGVKAGPDHCSGGLKSDHLLASITAPLFDVIYRLASPSIFSGQCPISSITPSTSLPTSTAIASFRSMTSSTYPNIRIADFRNDIVWWLNWDSCVFWVFNPAFYGRISYIIPL